MIPCIHYDKTTGHCMINDHPELHTPCHTNGRAEECYRFPQIKQSALDCQQTMMTALEQFQQIINRSTAETIMLHKCCKHLSEQNKILKRRLKNARRNTKQKARPQ